MDSRLKYYPNDITAIEILDVVLELLAKNQDLKGYNTPFLINRILGHQSIIVNIQDVEAILIKLKKDGYVDYRKQPPSLKPEGKVVAIEEYIISFEGVFQYEKGGYKAEMIETGLQKQKGNHLYWINFWIAVATCFAALYYIIEVLRIFFPCLFPNP